MFILTGYWIFQLNQFLETLSTKLSNAGDLDGILLTGDDCVSMWFVICKTISIKTCCADRQYSQATIKVAQNSFQHFPRRRF